jgi:hypothetical protein
MHPFKSLLIKTHWLLSSQFGLDPLRFLRSLRGLPRFISDWWHFREGHAGALVWMPCLHDRYEEGGATKSEYFWQDLLVARWIHVATPAKHVDVGSRVDGFVAHVASFREIEVFDVRPISTQIPGVIFTQADLMDASSIAPLVSGEGYCDSLSCLHALEHFGLGRYGDPIDPLGYRKGLENMASLLRKNGVFYLSTPIGKERVEFNANWVFDPHTIVETAKAAGLVLMALTIFNPKHRPQESSFDENTLRSLAAQQYNLGIFTFTKSNI